MIKRLFLTMLLSLVFAVPAAAEINGLYVGGKLLYSYQTSWGGGLFSSSESQSTLGGGVFLGYDFYANSDTPIRTEIEYAFRGNMYKDESGTGYESDTYYNMQTLLVNFYYDFYNDSAFTPYVGAGIGAAFMSGGYDITVAGRNYDGNMDDTVFAWNVGGGVGYSINEQVTADLGYRYLSTTDSNKQNNDYDIETSTSAHEVSLGLRFSF